MPRKSSASSRATKAESPVESSAPSRHEPLFSRPPVILAILGTMIVCAVYLWVVQPKAAPQAGHQEYKEGQEGSLDTISGLVDRVASLIVVKEDETPTVYSVHNVDEFTQAWPMATGVKEGDKVLEWSDKTVVYSPTEGKIVAVLPALSHENTPKEEEPVVAEEGVTIEIRNGSGVAGAASRLQADLRGKGFTVSRIGDARTRISTGGSIVVDLTNGGTPNALKLLTEAMGGTVAPLPEGEPTSDEDFLIIIGNE